MLSLSKHEDRLSLAVGRRAVLRLGLAGGAWLLVSGHTPYGQWGVYRKRFLLILTSRTDGPSFALGKTVAAVLAEALPASRARVSRAPHGERIASLISSKQMDVALMRPAAARALKTGDPPFADYGPVPLRTIAGVGGHLMICRDDFPDRHAYLIAAALAENAARLPVALTPTKAAPAAPDPMIPLHPGTVLFLRGAPAPAGPDPGDPAPRGQDHTHD